MGSAKRLTQEVGRERAGVVFEEEFGRLRHIVKEFRSHLSLLREEGAKEVVGRKSQGRRRS